jgi:hypothetical protein
MELDPSLISSYGTDKTDFKPVYNTKYTRTVDIINKIALTLRQINKTIPTILTTLTITSSQEITVSTIHAFDYLSNASGIKEEILFTRSNTGIYLLKIPIAYSINNNFTTATNYNPLPLEINCQNNLLFAKNTYTSSDSDYHTYTFNIYNNVDVLIDPSTTIQINLSGWYY